MKFQFIKITILIKLKFRDLLKDIKKVFGDLSNFMCDNLFQFISKNQ